MGFSGSRNDAEESYGKDTIDAGTMDDTAMDKFVKDFRRREGRLEDELKSKDQMIV